jgi:hypothetical protein
MSEYNTYGELYDQRPELLIHDRLKHSGTVQELIDLAKRQNYKICFTPGPFRHDTMIKWHKSDNRREESHSITSAMRYFKRASS